MSPPSALSAAGSGAVGSVTPPVFALSSCTQSHKDNRDIQNVSSTAFMFWCQVKKKKKSQKFKRKLHACCNVCICDCKSVCVQGGPGCYFLPSGRHERAEIFSFSFNAVDISCTNAPSCLHPIMGEKLPPPRKHTLSLSFCMKSPKEGKVSREGKKIKKHSLPPILPGARGSPTPAWVSPTTELCLDRNRRSAHRIGIQ